MCCTSNIEYEALCDASWQNMMRRHLLHPYVAVKDQAMFKDINDGDLWHPFIIILASEPFDVISFVFFLCLYAMKALLRAMQILNLRDYDITGGISCSIFVDATDPDFAPINISLFG